MRKWPNYILLTCSVLFALLIAEVILRMFIPQIGWAQREDSTIGWSSDEYQQFDPSHGQDKTGTRILFLGDSFLAGSGVSSLDERFPILLQSELGAKVSSRVIAAGGWGTDQELLAFVQKGKLWDPDIVVLAFCANNDISNILSHNHGAKKLKPYFVLEEGAGLTLYSGHGELTGYKAISKTAGKRASPLQPLRSYMIDYLRATLKSLEAPDEAETGDSYVYVDERYRQFRGWEERPEEIYEKRTTLSWSPQNGVNHVSAYIHENFAANTYQWRLFEAILKELKEHVERAGGRLVVMLLPVIFNPRDAETIAGGSFVKRFQTPDGYFTFRSIEPRERLQRISEAVGVTFLDPTQDFINKVTEGNLMRKVWPKSKDRHFSGVGHKILAEWLRDHADVFIDVPRTSGEPEAAVGRSAAAIKSLAFPASDGF